jgi:hypothetical protein
VPGRSKGRSQHRCGLRGGTPACNLRTGSACCRPAARPRGDRVRVQHRAGRPTGAHARERAHARGGAHWRHALPVRHAAVDAAAHRGAGAPWADRAQAGSSADARGACACAGSQLCAVAPPELHAWAGPCKQRSSHVPPSQPSSQASAPPCQLPCVCKGVTSAYHWVGWQGIWQSTLAPGPCRQLHPMAQLPRAERGRGERAVAGVAEHYV